MMHAQEAVSLCYLFSGLEFHYKRIIKVEMKEIKALKSYSSKKSQTLRNREISRLRASVSQPRDRWEESCREHAMGHCLESQWL